LVTASHDLSPATSFQRPLFRDLFSATSRPGHRARDIAQRLSRISRNNVFGYRETHICAPVQKTASFPACVIEKNMPGPRQGTKRFFINRSASLNFYIVHFIFT
jgi:hypothetical protein